MADAAASPGAEPATADDEPNLPILDLPAALVGELLALAQPVGLARMRRANKACHDVHVPLAERIIRQRLEAGFAARGQCRVAASDGHTVCVRPGDGMTESRVTV